MGNFSCKIQKSCFSGHFRQFPLKDPLDVKVKRWRRVNLASWVTKGALNWVVWIGRKAGLDVECGWRAHSNLAVMRTIVQSVELSQMGVRGGLKASGVIPSKGWDMGFAFIPFFKPALPWKHHIGYISLKGEGFISEEKETKTGNILMICVWLPSLNIIFYVLAVPWAMQDLSSPSKD